KLPDGIDFDTAAAMMLKGMTAQYLLKRTPMGQLRAGDRILFHAAAGGVGLIACQWAKALGYEVIATAGSDEKCELAKQHGAAHAHRDARVDAGDRRRPVRYRAQGRCEDPHRPALQARRRGAGASRPRIAPDHRLDRLHAVTLALDAGWRSRLHARADAPPLV